MPQDPPIPPSAPSTPVPANSPPAATPSHAPRGVAAAATPASEKTTWRERIGFATGTLPFNFGASGINTIAYPIYNIILGMNPALIGVVLGLSRVLDAVLDPVIGSASDNFRSKWGRRRPFIAVGAVLCAIAFPLIWMVPSDWKGWWAFGYFLVAMLVFYAAFAVYAVPYLTLGFELSADSNERVRIHAVRAIVSKLTFFIIPWVFPLAQWKIFGSPAAGMRALGLVIGALFIVLAIPTVLLTRERFAKNAARQEKVRLLPGLKMTFRNRPFRYLVGIVLGMIISDNIVRTMGTHINVYYVFGGDKTAGSVMQASSQTFYAFAGLAGVMVVAPLATRFGKLRVIRVCLVCGIAAAVSQFFFYNREYPWLQFVSMLLLAPSFSGFWVLIDPMKADTADFDEYKTGLRREGTYAAVATWIEKTTLTAAIFLFGAALDWSGFRAELGGAQTEGSLLVMRLLFSAGPALVMLGSFALAMRYPLDDDALAAMQGELTRRRSENAAMPLANSLPKPQ
ncbi:MFS transporter [Termitidicoccus mucosus]|uniref:MFS transporter n=1 Tax=Termitidicoccus mucosus TaxID=1184151 RepID=A0A178IKN7_9BACT|nr:hypothetical protein AW736_10470 [Opitutaceae bacterium TSB47]